MWVKNATMVFFPAAGTQALSRSISSPLDARFTVTPRSNCHAGMGGYTFIGSKVCGVVSNQQVQNVAEAA